MRSNPNQTLPQNSPTYVAPGSQLTVTIGRNVPGDDERSPGALSSADWAAFQADVTALVVDYFQPSMSFGPFIGEGEWEGVTEESAVLIFVTHYPGSVRHFEPRVAALAAQYGQDAIAWSFGPNVLTARS